MVPELEKARVTELHVRMDCNGCVQKIKKAMHGIDGVYDMYVDSAQQKLTIVGRADPEKIVKAIKKTGKIATICSHTQQVEPGGSEKTPSTEAATSSSPPATEAADQPPSEAPPAPPAEPPQEAPYEETKVPEVNPSPEAKDATPTESKDVEDIHMVHHYPHRYIYREHWNLHNPTSGHDNRQEAPCHVAHSYSSYRPSPYVTGYGHLQSPPQDIRYNGAEAHHDGSNYDNRGGGDGNQITSIFSDENPNACRIA